MAGKRTYRVSQRGRKAFVDLAIIWANGKVEEKKFESELQDVEKSLIAALDKLEQLQKRLEGLQDNVLSPTFGKFEQKYKLQATRIEMVKRYNKLMLRVDYAKNDVFDLGNNVVQFEKFVVQYWDMFKQVLKREGRKVKL